jgi:uncharacterized repeat protein (TIGR03803 family)
MTYIDHILRRGVGFLSAVALGFVVVACQPAQAQWAEIVLHSFCSQPNCTDGNDPVAGLIIDGKGNLYGTTSTGGAHSFGSVFEVTASGEQKVLYSFVPNDGSEPESTLVMDAGGNLYGTTFAGGLPGCSFGAGCGTVFEVDASGDEHVLYSFGTNPNDGASPQSGLVMDASGNLYGTTVGGGVSDFGTVFEITPSGAETVLYSFCPNGPPCSDGAYPLAGLVFDGKGNLYGTTRSGGAKNDGTVFEVTPAGAETVVHSFKGSPLDGSIPYDSLVMDTSGNLYGTSANGGAQDYGTVFKITPSGHETVLYQFPGPPYGSNPQAGLIFDTNGNLYGTTPSGGASGFGTVFELTPNGTATVLYSFAGGADGEGPAGGLVLDENGNLYGTTEGGGTGGEGVVFELTQQVGSATVSPTSLSFGNQVVDTTSAAQSVQLINTGGNALLISSVTVAGEFAISANTCPAQLPAGQSCTVSVTFTPLGPSLQTGSLSFVDNATGSPQIVALSGTGLTPVLLTPATFNYGRQKVGTTSNPATFTVTNNLSVALTGIAISTTGEFAVSSTTCGTSLGANSTCAINVTFTPTQTPQSKTITGPPPVDQGRKGQLSVNDSASNSPQTATLVGIAED